MPTGALAERRPWLLASLAAGISYWFIAGSALPGLLLIVWKGAGVGLLAAYAFAHHPTRDAHRIAGVMLLGALGDMALEVSFTGGAVLFLLGHLTAIALYARHRRTGLTVTDRVLAVALLAGVPLASLALTGRPEVALYALGLGGMAAAAWCSDFPRDRVGVGATMFAASDLLIFARMGPLANSAVPGFTVWPLYYFGQFLIVVGVIATLRARGDFTAD